MSDSGAVTALVRDLTGIFSERLRSVVTYGDRTSGPALTSLAIVDQLSAADLRACAGRVQRWRRPAWRRRCCSVEREFISRSTPSLRVRRHPRRLQGRARPPIRFRACRWTRPICGACEVQARSHLPTCGGVHRDRRTRQGCRGPDPAFSGAARGALRNIRHLDASAPVDGVLARVAKAGDKDAILSARRRAALFPQYLEALEQLTRAIDRWGHLLTGVARVRQLARRTCRCHLRPGDPVDRRPGLRAECRRCRN